MSFNQLEEDIAECNDIYLELEIFWLAFWNVFVPLCTFAGFRLDKRRNSLQRCFEEEVSKYLDRPEGEGNDEDGSHDDNDKRRPDPQFC